MPPKTQQSLRERALFTLRRPGLLLREIHGKDLIEMHLDEVATYLAGSPVIPEARAFGGTAPAKFPRLLPSASICTFESWAELQRLRVQRSAGGLVETVTGICPVGRLP